MFLPLFGLNDKSFNYSYIQKTIYKQLLVKLAGVAAFTPAWKKMQAFG